MLALLSGRRRDRLDTVVHGTGIYPAAEPDQCMECTDSGGDENGGQNEYEDENGRDHDSLTFTAKRILFDFRFRTALEG